MAEWRLTPVDRDPFEGTSFESSPLVPLPMRREDIPALGTEPIKKDPGFTDAIEQYVRDVYTGKIANEGPLGARYQGGNRAMDIATGIAGSGIQGLKLLQKGLPIPESITNQAPRIAADAAFNPTYGDTFSEPRRRTLVPVNYDPFADWFRKPSPAEVIGMGLPTFGQGSALGTPGASGSPAGGSQPSLSTMSPPGGDGSGGPPQQNNFRPPSGTSL